jgi:hypothetical protein
MNEREAWWKCNNCHTKNFITYYTDELKRKIFSCCNCGKIHSEFKVRESDSNWLSSLPFKDIGSKIPRGVNIEASTGIWFSGTRRAIRI